MRLLQKIDRIGLVTQSTHCTASVNLASPTNIPQNDALARTLVVRKPLSHRARLDVPDDGGAVDGPGEEQVPLGVPSQGKDGALVALERGLHGACKVVMLRK